MLIAAHVRVAVVTQTLAALVAGCEDAWVFSGSVLRVLVPVNASTIVADASGGVVPGRPRCTSTAPRPGRPAGVFAERDAAALLALPAAYAGVQPG